MQTFRDERSFVMKYRFFLPKLFTILFILSAILAAPGAVQAAPGKVTVANLTGSNIWVSYGTYLPYKSSAGNLQVVVPASITYIGWFKIEPGKSMNFPANAWFYVEQNQKRVYWSNKAETRGVIRHTKFDHVSIRYSNTTVPVAYTDSINGWVGKGYQIRTYQKMPVGFYEVTGNGYRVYSRSYQFDFGSRDYQTHRQCFDVPGNVVHYDYSVQRKHGPADIWDEFSNRVCLTVMTHGTAPHIGAARDRGYYRGSVTIYYTVRS